MQEYTSKYSSMKQVPFGFKIIDKHFGWKKKIINFDIGGGKYDLFTNKLKEINIKILIYDPYNRTKEINNHSLAFAKKFGVDTVTIFNVLNVIKEYDIQINIIKLGFDVLKQDGVIYIHSTHKNPKGISGETRLGVFQHYLTMNDYLDITKIIFPNARLKYGIIYATKEE